MRKEAKIEDSIKGFHWWLGALLLLLSTRVTDYEPKDLEQVRDLLVADDIITDGETTIKFRRNVGLTDDFTGDEFVNNAKVVVEREDGAVSTCANSSGKGEYKVDVGELDPGGRYRPHISLGGLGHESDYLESEIASPIDSLSLSRKGPGGEVRLRVSMHNAPDRSSYFRWMYKENWEVKAEIFMAAEKAGNTAVIYDLLTSNDWYYCWGENSSKMIPLDSSDRLTWNVIADKNTASYHPSDRRFSMLYHAGAEQYALHRGACDCYPNLQKNIGESGSLFAPTFSEVKRDIRCVTDSEALVIGFVEVAAVIHLKRFLPEIEKVYKAEITGYASMIVQGSEYDSNPDYGYVSYNPMNAENNTYILKRCTDCGRFDSKQKPFWWSTSHL